VAAAIRGQLTAPLWSICQGIRRDPAPRRVRAVLARSTQRCHRRRRLQG
jgi:hypothetical protein